MKKTIFLIAFLLLLTACAPAQAAPTQTATALPTNTPAPTPTPGPCSPEALAPWWAEIQPVREATTAAAEDFFINATRGTAYTEAELQAVQDGAQARIDLILALDTPTCAEKALIHLHNANIALIAGAINIDDQNQFQVALGTYAINIDNLTLELQSFGLLNNR